jgi:hypothetical protein
LVYFDIFHVYFHCLTPVFQALDLTKARARNRAMVMAQGARRAELEADNTKLRSELNECTKRWMSLLLPGLAVYESG